MNLFPDPWRWNVLRVDIGKKLSRVQNSTVEVDGFDIEELEAIEIWNIEWKSKFESEINDEIFIIWIYLSELRVFALTEFGIESYILKT